MDATGDVFLMEMNLGGSYGSSDTSLQGGCNIIVENKMSVSEISGGANITLTGTGESSITATDKSVLINLSGALVDSKDMSIGFGLAVTVNNSLTGAMLGNGLAIKEAYGDTWKALMGGTDKPFSRDADITLSLMKTGDLRVEAHDMATIVDIGIAGTSKRKKASAEGDEEPEEGEDNAVSVAANLGVLVNQTEATARQYRVVGPASSSVPGFVVGAGTNKITTKAGTKTPLSLWRAMSPAAWLEGRLPSPLTEPSVTTAMKRTPPPTSRVQVHQRWSIHRGREQYIHRSGGGYGGVGERQRGCSRNGCRSRKQHTLRQHARPPYRR